MARPIDPQRHRARRLQIIDAGLTVFARCGYVGATTADICREARIGSGTFFHYFPTKDSLILAILQEGSTETREFFAAQAGRTDPVQVLLDWVHHTLQDLRDPRATGFIAVVSGLSMREEIATALRAEEETIRAGLVHWLHRAQETDQVRHDLPAERLAGWIMLLVDGFSGRVGASGEFDVPTEEPLLLEVITSLLVTSSPRSCPASEQEQGRHAHG